MSGFAVCSCYDQPSHPPQLKHCLASIHTGKSRLLIVRYVKIYLLAFLCIDISYFLLPCESAHKTVLDLPDKFRFGYVPTYGSLL